MCRIIIFLISYLNLVTDALADDLQLDNTMITLIGTGSGTPDFSFALQTDLVNTIIGNHKLLQIEPKFLHNGNTEYVMGYRSTLIISSSNNGYVQPNKEGRDILLRLLKLIPLKESIYTHISERTAEMLSKQQFIITETLANDNIQMVFQSSNCTAPIVGPDPWTQTQYNIESDDCGFFTGAHEEDNNCYAYGTDIATNTYPQPGRGSGKEWTNNTCEDMFAAAQRDGLNMVGRKLTNYSIGPSDGHYVALYIWPNTNFHWARMDYNGTYDSNERGIRNQVPRRWSHKPGGTPVQIVDNNGDCIGDIAPCVLPSEADLAPWTVFCGYMSGIPSNLTIK